MALRHFKNMNSRRRYICCDLVPHCKLTVWLVFWFVPTYNIFMFTPLTEAVKKPATSLEEIGIWRFIAMSPWCGWELRYSLKIEKWSLLCKMTSRFSYAGLEPFSHMKLQNVVKQKWLTSEITSVEISNARLKASTSCGSTFSIRPT